MRDLCKYKEVVELMEEDIPKPTVIRSSVRYKPIKERVSLPKSPSQKEFFKVVSDDIYRQAASKTLMVDMSSLELYRNELTKKVKLLDVKLSFSYQEDFTTQTARFERQLVRQGNKWTWVNDNGTKSVMQFPYLPGDKVNLNVGLFIHKTKKHGLFGKETITTQVGTAAECLVLARDNGVGMGLQLDTPYTQSIRLNFDINGRGHKLTLKVLLNLQKDSKGQPMMWLRPKSSNKCFRSKKSAFELLQELPPKSKDEDARVKMYVFNNQRLVNYQKVPILECLSIQPRVCETEIPTGIELRQVLRGQLLAFLVPVVKIIDKEMYRYRLAILVVTAEGPHCLCSAKWKTADKFDYKIYMFKTKETFGQRIKWSSKDFLDINYAILNSTGHQLILKTDSESLIEDICIGLSLKLLVRWNREPLPWKQTNKAPMIECHKYLSAQYSNVASRITDFGGKDIHVHMRNLPQFLESQELMMCSDVEEFIARDNADCVENIEVTLRETDENSVEERNSKEPKQHGELNIEDQDDDDDDDDVDTNASSYKHRIDVDWEDVTSSTFIDGHSENTCGGSWLGSLL